VFLGDVQALLVPLQAIPKKRGDEGPELRGGLVEETKMIAALHWDYR
jgi:hypothetical protein